MWQALWINKFMFVNSLFVVQKDKKSWVKSFQPDGKFSVVFQDEWMKKLEIEDLIDR